MPWYGRQRERDRETHLTAFFSGTTRVSRYKKGKTNLDFTEASGSGISWAICKSAPRSKQITAPAPHHSSFLQARCPSCRPTNSTKGKCNGMKKSKNFKTTLPVPVALFLKNASRFVNDNESATNTEDNNNYYYTCLTAFFPRQPG